MTHRLACRAGDEHDLAFEPQHRAGLRSR